MCEQPNYSKPLCNAETHIIPCFCSGIGGAGDTERVNACNRLGVAGEWRYRPGDNLSCFHFPGSVVEGGSILGYKAICERADYKGNVGECCSNPGQCFSSNGGTCPPEARSYTGKTCQNYYLQYCSTNNLNDLQERWQEGGLCRRALDNNTLAGDLKYVSDLGSQLLGSYFHRGGISETPSELQNMIYDICRDNPLACSRYLDESLCKNYTREDLISLPQARKFCGCHLREELYETFESEFGGIPKECDSICVSASNIRPVNSLGAPLFCQNSICIIDSVTIDLVNSNVGSISFGQLCGNCSDGSCVCIIKDVDIDAEDSTIGGINFDQECGNQKCYQTASNGNVLEVDCDLSIPERQNEADEKEGITWWWIILAVAAGIFILIIIILIFVFIFKKK